MADDFDPLAIYHQVQNELDVTDVPEVKVVPYIKLPKRVKHRLAKDTEAVLVAAGFAPHHTA
jgi:hypothetical protein